MASEDTGSMALRFPTHERLLIMQEHSFGKGSGGSTVGTLQAAFEVGQSVVVDVEGVYLAAFLDGRVTVAMALESAV